MEYVERTNQTVPLNISVSFAKENANNMKAMNRSLHPQVKILLLSSARCNGTIILRHMGQCPEAVIVNEMLTHFYSKVGPTGYIPHDSVTLPEYWSQVDALNQVEGRIVIAHEMAGDLTTEMLRKLRADGWTVVFVGRDPHRQYNSLHRLRDSGNDYMTKEFIDNIVMVGACNIVHFHANGLIDHVLVSELYLGYESYRAGIADTLKVPFPAAAGPMNRWLGAEFHKTCAITGSWPNAEKNPWNGPSGSSLELKEDNGISDGYWPEYRIYTNLVRDVLYQD
jgi:hypothetical protein